MWLARRYGPMGRQVVAAVEPKSHLVLMSEADYDRVTRGEKSARLMGVLPDSRTASARGCLRVAAAARWALRPSTSRIS